MKQVTLNIKDSKFQFFMELIKSLDFVQVEETTDDGDSREDIIKNIKQGLKELKDYQSGKVKAISAKDFLNEL